MSVVLENPKHPDHGIATIPLLIQQEEFNLCIRLPEALKPVGAAKTAPQTNEVFAGWRGRAAE